MATPKYSPRRGSFTDPPFRHEIRATLAAFQRSRTCDELAALPDHHLAAVAECGDGSVRRLALAVWHTRERRVPQVADDWDYPDDGPHCVECGCPVDSGNACGACLRAAIAATERYEEVDQ